MFETLDVECRTEPIEDGIIVHLGGDIDLTRAASLSGELSRVQRKDPDRLVVDFSDVGSIDSSVVATIVEALRTVRRRGGMLVLSGMSEWVRGIFEITGLADGPLLIDATIADAVARPHRRRADRFSSCNITCNRGAVLDLSSTGLRLLTTRRLREIVKLTLRSQSGRVNVQAEVCWSQHLGFRRHETGLHFVDLSEEAVRLIDGVIADARERAVMQRET